MQNILLISAIIIVIVISAIYLFGNLKKHKEFQAKSKDYETLLDGLQQQLESQKALVEALTNAVEFSSKNKNSDFDSLVSEVGDTAKEQLVLENSKLKAQLAFYIEVKEKRDLELKKMST